MLKNAVKRLIRWGLLAALVAAIREWSIRRHADDLHDWPRQ